MAVGQDNIKDILFVIQERANFINLQTDVKT